MDIATAMMFLSTAAKVAQQGGKFAALLKKSVNGETVTLDEFSDAVADRVESSDDLHAKLRAIAGKVPPPPPPG